MRNFSVLLTVLVIFGAIAALFVTRVGAVDPVGQPTVEQVHLLKQQAGERKAFYAEQAKAKELLKIRHQQERQDLLKRHRAARAEFTAKKNTPEERATFYRSQRREMAELRVRHKKEAKGLGGKLKKRLTEFHRQQAIQRTSQTQDNTGGISTGAN